MHAMCQVTTRWQAAQQHLMQQRIALLEKVYDARSSMLLVIAWISLVILTGRGRLLDHVLKRERAHTADLSLVFCFRAWQERFRDVRRLEEHDKRLAASLNRTDAAAHFIQLPPLSFILLEWFRLFSVTIHKVDLLLIKFGQGRKKKTVEQCRRRARANMSLSLLSAWRKPRESLHPAPG